ncbi:hypothetical protein DFH05DRAFT_401420 [Lentinula detonsa]|uniref:Uncharacterized protein n=1 Tax=Lentinula detonsa TaxID=2804962 RepID=A0A9W8NT76_9AGAR|nr:hypothetical protein DFH05DRAFT_401420 [Lentinula detonsa]
MGSANTGSTVCSTDEKPKRSPRTRIETLHLGVYRVMIEKRISSTFAFDFTKTMESWRGGIRVLTKLVEDIVRIAPALLLIVALVKVWESHEEVVLLSLENRILRIIETGLSSKDGIAARALIMTVLSRIIFVVCSSLMNHWSRDVQSRVRTKVLHHYDDFLLIG